MLFKILLWAGVIYLIYRRVMGKPLLGSRSSRSISSEHTPSPPEDEYIDYEDVTDRD